METTQISPLFPAGHGDLCLLSTDGTIFYVHRHFLVYASPVFERKLGARPQDPFLGTDTNPLRIKADASTITCLLQYVYPPRQRMNIASLDQLAAVLRAAKCYEMQGVMEQLRGILTDPNLEEGSVVEAFYIRSPLHALVIADNYGFLPEAKLALRECLDGDLTKHLRSTANFDIPARLMVAILDLRNRRLDLLRSKLKSWAPVLPDGWEACSRKLSEHRYKIEAALYYNPSFQTLSDLLAESPRTCNIWNHTITIPGQVEQKQWEREWRVLHSVNPEVPTNGL